MRILNWKNWMLVREFREFHSEDEINLSIDDDGINNLKVSMVETGYSVDRRLIYYKFKIKETSNPKKYPIDSEMFFPIDFDGKTFDFLIHIPEHSFHMNLEVEKHYHGTVKII